MTAVFTARLPVPIKDGGPSGIRTQTLTLLESGASANCAKGPLMGAERFELSLPSKGNSVLRTGAANLIRLAPKRKFYFY
jgi:hypothetical protein